MFWSALGLDNLGEVTASYSIPITVTRPAKASVIDCPIVADPKPKPNRPRFGCSFAAIGSLDVENVTMQYVENGQSKLRVLHGIGIWYIQCNAKKLEFWSN